MTIEENISLSSHTTLKVGGKARYFCRVTEPKELEEAVTFSEGKKIPFFVLGGGSNVLISDSGFSGLVIKMDILGLEYEEKGNAIFVKVGAGESWDYLVKTTVEKGLYGLENFSGIPGTVGASPIQNIGAYGVEVKDTIFGVEVFDTVSKKSKQLTNKECHFSYRDSYFKTESGKKLIVIKVCFRLSKKGKVKTEYKDVASYFEKKGTEKPTPSLVREAVLEIRSQKFPDISKIGTAGSFFKNPIISKKEFSALKKKFPDIPQYPAEGGKIKISLAWILDHVCNLRGFSQGDVALFQNQPLVLINKGKASSEQIISFSKNISQIVKEKTGIEVEPEVQFFS